MCIRREGNWKCFNKIILAPFDFAEQTCGSHKSGFIFLFFKNVCKICKCCVHPYLLYNYPSRAGLALLASFCNYCNSLLGGFPGRGRCSHRHSTELCLPPFSSLETTSWSLCSRIAAGGWPGRFGLQFVPSERISALSGEVSSSENVGMFQGLLSDLCVSK